MSDARPVVTVLSAAGGPTGANAELIGAGRQLASALHGPLMAVVLGAEEATDLRWAVTLGADEVVSVRAHWLNPYQADASVAALDEVCAKLQPSILLFVHDAVARAVAPRLAARLGGGLVTDCTSLQIDGAGKLMATRPCFSGKALSEWMYEGSRVGVATLRRRAFPAADADPGRAGMVSTMALAIQPELRETLIEEVLPPPGQVRLEDAEVVVAVGRGIGSREAFQEYFLDGLAKALGAACGGSRGAVDSGIISPELQIGLTGRVVSPRLYIAVGLSGSPQHMAGCSGAGTIVAVNTDPQAPIFGYAHYGVVGDYRRVIPSLTERLKERAANGR